MPLPSAQSSAVASLGWRVLHLAAKEGKRQKRVVASMLKVAQAGALVASHRTCSYHPLSGTVVAAHKAALCVSAPLQWCHSMPWGTRKGGRAHNMNQMQHLLFGPRHCALAAFACSLRVHLDGGGLLPDERCHPLRGGRPFQLAAHAKEAPQKHDGVGAATAVAAHTGFHGT